MTAKNPNRSLFSGSGNVDVNSFCSFIAASVTLGEGSGVEYVSSGDTYLLSAFDQINTDNIIHLFHLQSLLKLNYLGKTFLVP